MDFKKAKELLDGYKQLVGFADWRIIVPNKKVDMPNLAIVTIDILEKEATVNLSKTFFELPYRRQRNILIHELLHGRFAALKKRVEDLADTEEELYINDITRGLEQINVKKKRNSGKKARKKLD